eukprot:352485-Chlamydomonas_euryale.AAC.1
MARVHAHVCYMTCSSASASRVQYTCSNPPRGLQGVVEDQRRIDASTWQPTDKAVSLETESSQSYSSSDRTQTCRLPYHTGSTWRIASTDAPSATLMRSRPSSCPVSGSGCPEQGTCSAVPPRVSHTLRALQQVGGTAQGAEEREARGASHAAHVWGGQSTRRHRLGPAHV